MKVRESGMPEEKTWDGFFSPSRILKRMGINKKVKDAVDFGCGYGTFTITTARMVNGKVYAIDIDSEMVKEPVPSFLFRHATFSNFHFSLL